MASERQHCFSALMMPLYFFDVIDGEAELDTIGTVLADASSMRQEATKFVASLLAEEPLRRQLGTVWRLRVRDASGVQVLGIQVED